MPIHSAEAVILRQYPLAEADRIIVFFTREFGKIRAVAKGAKRPKSRLGGCLEPLNHVLMQFYGKEGNNLGRILQCEIVHSYLGRNPSLAKVFGLAYLAEIIQEIVEENNPNHLIFRLFVATLEASERVGLNESLIRYFELWCLKLSGLLPDYVSCSQCGRCVKDVGFYVWLEVGQGRCQECAGSIGVYIRPAAANVLHTISSLSPEEFASRPLPGSAAQDLERLAQRHLEWHLEKRLKSYAALKEMLRNS